MSVDDDGYEYREKEICVQCTLPKRFFFFYDSNLSIISLHEKLIREMQVEF